MKRSEVNALIDDAIAMLERYRVKLPPFAVLVSRGVGRQGTGVRRDSALQARLGHYRFRLGRFRAHRTGRVHRPERAPRAQTLYPQDLRGEDSDCPRGSAHADASPHAQGRGHHLPRRGQPADQGIQPGTGRWFGRHRRGYLARRRAPAGQGWPRAPSHAW